jgi:predicted acylesterase/phospholipase RssA
MNSSEDATGNIATGRIGMVLSGGGSRAAAFHFGALEYLDRIGLISRVNMISTVSGGSFVGAKYALCMAHDQDFNSFFKEFYYNLLRTRALADTLRKLAELPQCGDGYSIPSKRRDLIVCAAQTYAETFLRRGSDGPAYLFGDVVNAPEDYPLEEVVFNTTEYRTGVAFRFQRHGRLGNVNVCPPPDKVGCWNCDSVMDAPASIHATCLSCGAELRTCRQCEFYDLDPGKGCISKPVVDKRTQVEDTRAANRCEWFDPRPVSTDLLKKMEREAATIRIADVVAASSCLPGVFGPLGFPDDFAWPGGEVPATIRAVFSHGGKPRPITLMDGGIYDNQGIESLMLADQQVDRDTLTNNVLSGILREGGGTIGSTRTEDTPGTPHSRLGIVIVSDADRREENILPYESQFVDHSVPDAPKGMSLGNLNQLAWLIMVVCLVAVLVAAGNLLDDILVGVGNWWETLLYVVTLVLAGGTAYSLRWLRREFDSLRTSIPQNDDTTWEKIKQVRTTSLRDSVRLGIAGMSKTVNAVMPKRMRELGYWMLYTSPNYQDKRISNLIYHLQSGQSMARLRMCEFLDRHRLPVMSNPVSDDDEQPSGKVDPAAMDLQSIIDAAASMDTRFWFEPDSGESRQDRGRGELDRALVCGEATMCFNLMKFIDRIHGSKPYPPEVAALWESLTKDWRAMYDSPFRLLDERFKRAEVPLPASRQKDDD